MTADVPKSLQVPEGGSERLPTFVMGHHTLDVRLPASAHTNTAGSERP